MSKLKLYSVTDSPPTLAVRMLIHEIQLPHELVQLNFGTGEHMTDAFAKINPQKEIPAIDDNGFLLSESVAILQYIADKYSKNESLYPRDPRQRAVVNHRLLFNISTYYKYISEYAVGPIFYSYAYKRTAEGLKKLNIGLDVFNTYLQRGGTKFAAGENVTIADYLLVTSTSCLEAIDFPLARYPLVVKWYQDFKQEKPELWSIAEVGMKEVREFSKNPPDLSGLNHPLHPPPKK